MASALLCDYVLTVAVSTSSGVAYLAAAVPAVSPYKVEVAVGVVTLLAVINLRGARESGAAFAIPHLRLHARHRGAGGHRLRPGGHGTLGTAASASYEVVPEDSWDSGLTGLAGAFLILRAFSSGCAALTGVEAISNGVPRLSSGPSRATPPPTLLLLGCIAAAMLLSIIHLAGATGVRMVENPATDLLANGVPLGEAYHQDPVIGQFAATVFADVKPMFYLVTAVTGLILVLAAHRLQRFPGAGQRAGTRRVPAPPDGPARRPPRLLNIAVLWLGSIAFIVGFQANTNRLIQALHRGRLHLLHAQPDRHGASLDP